MARFFHCHHGSSRYTIAFKESAHTQCPVEMQSRINLPIRFTNIQPLAIFKILRFFQPWRRTVLCFHLSSWLMLDHWRNTDFGWIKFLKMITAAVLLQKCVSMHHQLELPESVLLIVVVKGSTKIDWKLASDIKDTDTALLQWLPLHVLNERKHDLYYLCANHVQQP